MNPNALAHWGIVIPDFLTQTENSINSSGSGCPIFLFHSFTMLVTEPADMPISFANWFLVFPFNHP